MPIPVLINYKGIYLNGSSHFNIVHDNKFYYFRTGIECAYSGNNGGYVGSALPDWHANIFNRCDTSILTYGDNSYLKMKCNEFNFSGSGNSPYHYSWYNHNGYLADQGAYPPNLTPLMLKTRYPAGNEFNDYHKKIADTLEIYDYYHHDPTISAAGDALVPTPNSFVNIYDVVGVAKTTGSCASVIAPQPIISSTPLTAPPFSQLDSLQQVTVTLKSKLDSLTATLDGGDTQLLLDELAGHRPK